MGRLRVVPISVLNIAMHAPHSPEGYVSLMTHLFSLQKIITIRTITGALLGSMEPIHPSKPINGITGEILQFTNIDPTEPWFDLNSREEASDKDVRKIVIPEHLKPNLARFAYVFYPEGHRLYVQTRSKNRTIGIKTVKSFIEALLVDPRMSEFPRIEVTVVPDKDTVKAIFRIKHLTKLDMTIVRPNADELDEAEQRVLDRLARQNANKMEIILQTDPSGSLNPDADTKTLAGIASTNGKVVGRGKDSMGRSVELSTADHPLQEYARFNDETQTERDAIIYKAHEMHNEL
uniref:DUF4747 family protein n=1 Tax=Xanthomonas sp. 0924 TaxID=2835534 RepID=UPI003F802A65